jgi:hypothetical protein
MRLEPEQESTASVAVDNGDPNSRGMGTEKTVSRYIYNKLHMVTFPDRSERGSEFLHE